MREPPKTTAWTKIDLELHPGRGNSDPCLRWYEDRWHCWWTEGYRGKTQIEYAHTEDPGGLTGWKRFGTALPVGRPGTPTATGVEVASVVRWNGMWNAFVLDKPGPGHFGNSGIYRCVSFYTSECPNKGFTGGPLGHGQPVIWPSPVWARPYTKKNAHSGDDYLTGGITEICVRKDGEALRCWAISNIGHSPNTKGGGWGNVMLHAATIDKNSLQWAIDPVPCYQELGDIGPDGAPAPAWWTVMQHDVVILPEGRGYLLYYKPQWEEIRLAHSKTGLAPWTEIGSLRKNPDIWKGQLNGPTADVGPDGKLYSLISVGPERGMFTNARFELAVTEDAV